MKNLFLLLVTFFALQASAQIYLNENFDTGMPVTWTVVDGGGATGDSWVSGIQGSTIDGTNHAFVDSDANGNGILMQESLESEPFDASLATSLWLDFDQFYQWIGNDTAFVDVFDGVSWVNVLTQTGANVGASGAPDQQHIDITAYQNAAMQIRFRYDDGNVWAWWWLVDNVLVYNSTCPQPVALSASAITTTTADLNWTESGTATSWEVEWGTSGFTQGTGTSAITATNPHTATGLVPNSSFDFYVRAVCGPADSSLWVGPFQFLTPCTSVIAPFVDNVEGHAATTTLGTSNCWNATATGTYDWDISGIGTTPSTGTGPLAAYSGTNFFFTEASSGTAGDVAELTTPFVDISALTVPSLEFYYHMFGTVMGNLYIDVYDGATWTTVDSLIGQQQAAQADPWLQHFTNLSAFTGTIQVRFRAVSAGTFEGDIALDNIAIMEAPTCPAPNALFTTAITTTTADLNWTENGTATSWEVEWGLAGFTQGTGTSAVTATNPHTATGLLANSSYEFYVRAICGPADSSLWAGPSQFLTPCTSVIAPFLDDVEGHAATTTLGVSNCWNASATGLYAWDVSGIGTTPSTGTGPLAAHSGTNFFFTEASSGTAGDVAELYTPFVDVSGLTAPSLDFYHHMFGTIMGNLYIDVFDGATWTTVDSLIGQQQVAQADPWIQHFTNLSAFTGTIQVRFRAVSAGTFEGDIALDNISIIEAPTCPAPNALNTSNVTVTSVDLGWTENGTATSWEVEYGPAGFVPGAGTSVITATNPHNLTGLTGATSYDFYVRAVCGPADSSLWVGPNTFTTAGTCGFFAVEIFDTFGDGWNGGILDIYVNGGLFAGGVTLLGGTGPDTTFVPVNIGDIISVDYTASGFPTENEYSVFDQTLTLVASEGLGGLTPNDIGDFTIPTGLESCPSCPAPTALTANAITATSADLGWTENGTAISWEVEYGPVGFTPGTGTSNITGTNPFNVTGLTSSTAYDFYVRAICAAGDSSIWAGPTSFLTTCVSVVAPWADSVETHVATTTLTTSNCWSATSTSTFDWDITGTGNTPSVGTGPLVAHSGTNFFYTEASNGIAGDVAELNTPLIDLTGISSANLNFYYHMFGIVMGNLYIDVNDGATWTTVDSIIGQQQVAETDPWLMKTVDLSAFSGTIQIKFRAISGGNFEGDICLDNIEVVGSAVSCPIPSLLTVTAVGTNNVDLTWTENGAATNWEVEWDTAGFTPGTGNTFITASNPHTLFGLLLFTDYDYYVRAICAPGDTSAWSSVHNFTTLNVGINETASNLKLNVVPNPNDGVFTLNIESTNANKLNVSIVNTQGQVIYAKNNFTNVTSVSERIDLTNEASGFYIVTVVSDTDGIATFKLIVQ